MAYSINTFNFLLPRKGLASMKHDLFDSLYLQIILVDAVKEVLELKSAEITPSPSIGSKYNSDFIEGMWRQNDSFIMILDILKVLTSDENIDFCDIVEE